MLNILKEKIGKLDAYRNSLRERIEVAETARSARLSKPVIEPIKSYTCSVVGTFADCAFPRGFTREGQIMKMKPSETLYLEEFEYEGKPAFYVCRTKNRVDIGCVPATTAARLAEKYPDCEYKVVILEKKNDHHDNTTFRIRIDIYKK